MRTAYRVYQENDDGTWEFVFQSPSFRDAITFMDTHTMERLRLYQYDITLLKEHRRGNEG